MAAIRDEVGHFAPLSRDLPEIEMAVNGKLGRQDKLTARGSILLFLELIESVGQIFDRLQLGLQRMRFYAG
jgi:hypothetical protein